MKFSLLNRSFLRAGVATALVLSAGSASAFSDTFDNGLAGWTFGGDVSVQLFGANSYAALTTASAMFDDDSGVPLNLSGQEPLAVAQPGGVETLAGLPLGGVDLDPVLQQGTEGSVLVRQVNVNAGERLSFSWMFSTRDTDFSSGLGLDYAFVVINGQRIDLGNAAGANQAGSDGYLKSTGWQSFSYLFNQAGAVTLAFGVVDVVDYNSSSQLALDNVSIAAVPEPETYALFLAGLGLIGAVARRRRST